MSTTQSAPHTESAVHAAEAFEFVRSLASELSSGKVELPSFPDIAVRVQRLLADVNVTPDRVVRIVGSEPALAARILTMANSAALSVAGRQVTDLRTAIARMGFDTLRSAAITFAMGQLRKAEQYKSLEKQMSLLWHRSVAVAAFCLVICKRHTRLSADTAMLAGLLHGVGKLYILTRAMKHPSLFADQAAYNTIVRDWHGNIAKALLENWEMAPQIVDAIHGYDDAEREVRGGPSIADVLASSDMFVSFKDQPELLAGKLNDFAPAQRLSIDKAASDTILQDSAEELAAVKAALGN